MAELFHSEEAPQKIYWDRRYYASQDDQIRALKGSSTLYVGNLDFKTTEQQIHDTFARVGPIKKIIMGINSETKVPCGFCFIEYYNGEHASNCLKYISGSICGQNVIRCELDPGFKPGRQYGRGKSGGQVKDERKNLTISYSSPQKSVRGKRGRDSSLGSNGRPDEYGRDLVKPVENAYIRENKRQRHDPLTDGLQAERGSGRSASKFVHDESDKDEVNVTSIAETASSDDVKESLISESSTAEEDQSTKKNPRFREESEEVDEEES